MKSLSNIGSEDLVAKLVEYGKTVNYSPDETVFSQGDHATFFPIVVEGKVKIFRFLSPGKEVIVNVFSPGEAFAIPPVMDDTTYPANAVAIENTVLLKISRSDFLSLLGESKEFSTFVMHRMSGLLRETTRAIEILATSSTETKIAGVLLWLAEKESGKKPITISIRRQDIAQIAGLTTESAIRAIRKLYDEGALEIVRGKIVIHDPQALSAYLN